MYVRAKEPEVGADGRETRDRERRDGRTGGEREMYRRGRAAVIGRHSSLCLSRLGTGTGRLRVVRDPILTVPADIGQYTHTGRRYV